MIANGANVRAIKTCKRDGCWEMHAEGDAADAGLSGQAVLGAPDARLHQANVAAQSPLSRHSPRALAHRFQVMTLGVDDEGGVVAGPVVFAQPRRAVVAAASSQRGGVELGHRLA